MEESDKWKAPRWVRVALGFAEAFGSSAVPTQEVGSMHWPDGSAAQHASGVLQYHRRRPGVAL